MAVAQTQGQEPENPAHIMMEKEPDIDVKSESSGDEAITDLFVSFPEVKGIEPETNILTVRAVVTGIVLGSLVNASNVYLGMLSALVTLHRA